MSSDIFYKIKNEKLTEIKKTLNLANETGGN